MPCCLLCFSCGFCGLVFYACGACLLMDGGGSFAIAQNDKVEEKLKSKQYVRCDIESFGKGQKLFVADGAFALFNF